MSGHEELVERLRKASELRALDAGARVLLAEAADAIAALEPQGSSELTGVETLVVPKAEWDALVEAMKRPDLRSVDAAVNVATHAIRLVRRTLGAGQ